MTKKLIFTFENIPNFWIKKNTPIPFEQTSHTEVIHQLHAYLYTLADSKNRE
jgi:hypothetical protein